MPSFASLPKKTFEPSLFYFSHSRSLYEFHCYLASRHATGKKFKNSNFYLSLKCDPVISPVSKKVFKKVVPFYFWSLVFKHYVQTTLRKSIPKGTTFLYYRIFALRFRILYFSIFIDTLARKIAGYSRCVATTKTFFPRLSSSSPLFSLGKCCQQQHKRASAALLQEKKPE